MDEDEAATDHDKVSTAYHTFEISDLDFWRSEAYTAYFDHLDRYGGFYYEVSTRNSECDPNSSDRDRVWISVGATRLFTRSPRLLMGKDRIHFSREIGYEHHPVSHCPASGLCERGRCTCNTQTKFCPRRYSRSRQDGQKCRKDSRPQPERCQVQRTWCCPQRRRDHHPRRELFIGPLGGEPASPSDSEQGPYLHLSSHYLSPQSLLSSLFLNALSAIMSPVCPHRVSCFCPKFPTLDTVPLLTMTITGHRR